MPSPGELRPQAMKGNPFLKLDRWTYELLTESHLGKVCFVPKFGVLFAQRSGPGDLLNNSDEIKTKYAA